jgi:ParB family chromosome partitioning protein
MGPLDVAEVGSENLARADLSYIERAHFARNMVQAGVARDVIAKDLVDPPGRGGLDPVGQGEPVRPADPRGGPDRGAKAAGRPRAETLKDAKGLKFARIERSTAGVRVTTLVRATAPRSASCAALVPDRRKPVQALPAR